MKMNPQPFYVLRVNVWFYWIHEVISMNDDLMLVNAIWFIVSTFI